MALLLSTPDIVLAARRLASPALSRGRERRRLRILLVDDSAIAREAEAALLRSLGHEVEEAVDGEDGWTRLQTGGFHVLEVNARSNLWHYLGAKNGVNLQQIYEAGEPFEALVDHPSWIEHVKCFVGGEGTFDYHHGPLFIDECFASIRGPGDAIGIHSGAYPWVKRCQYHFSNGRFNCGQVNMLLALTDIGERLLQLVEPRAHALRVLLEPTHDVRELAQLAAGLPGQ